MALVPPLLPPLAPELLPVPPASVALNAHEPPDPEGQVPVISIPCTLPLHVFWLVSDPLKERLPPDTVPFALPDWQESEMVQPDWVTVHVSEVHPLTVQVPATFVHELLDDPPPQPGA